MTDGRSSDSVSGPARALRKAGVEIISFGLGVRYNIRQLKQMASNRRLVFTARFRNINSVVRVIKRKACGTTGQSDIEHLITFQFLLSGAWPIAFQYWTHRSCFTSVLMAVCFCVPGIGPKPVPKPKPPRPGQASYYWEGCYNDRSTRAINKFLGNFNRRKNPVKVCAMKALSRRYKVFALENGGECYSSLSALKTYNRYGPTNRCRSGTGGLWAMDVYKFGRRKLISWYLGVSAIPCSLLKSRRRRTP